MPGLSVEHGRLAIAVLRSSNDKIGDCATTHAAQQSCPSSCAFKDGGGCYAENGRLFTSVTRPLNGAADLVGAGPVDVALEEAAAIDALDLTASLDLRGRPMRLHTVGDCRTDEAARIVSAAAERYMERGGGPVWTYTHAWRLVDRVSWGRVSVLASCETAEQVELARGRGYAPSIVLPSFRARKRHFVHGIPVLPCPAQTTLGVTCSSCRLCMDDGGLLERGYSIAFEVHGTFISVRQAQRALEAPSDPDRRKTSRDVAIAYREQHGRWPSTSELMEVAGVTKSSAYEMLGKLRAGTQPATSRSSA